MTPEEQRFLRLIERHALGRTLADQATRACRRSLFQLDPQELLVLRDWLEEQGLEAPLVEISAWLRWRWRRGAIQQWERPRFSWRKLKIPAARPHGLTLSTALEQVHLHGQRLRIAVFNGDLEGARLAWSHRRAWVRHALDARAIERDSMRQGRLVAGRRR